MEQDNVEINRMEITDLDEIKDILENEFDNFWNYQIFKSELENPNSVYFIIKENDEICGFIGILQVLDTADIMNILSIIINRLSWREPSLNLIIEDINKTATYIPLSMYGIGQIPPSDKLPKSSYLKIHPL